MRLIEDIWRGEDKASRAARLALAPLAGAYRAIVASRGWMYDHSLLRVETSPIPVVSIGNISVGGTGKTPFAAWLAAELSRRGARPAVVLRGYGRDEPLVHARINPGVPVVIEPKRAAGIREAAALGATVAVLDDAFQHRAASRLADIALIAAEQWKQPVRLLPAGPWRESLAALKRATVIVITRKTADDARVEQLASAIRRAAPDRPQVVARFMLNELRRLGQGAAGEALPLSAMASRHVTAIAGLADNDAFFRQLSETGALVAAHPFPDHHQYTGSDIGRLLTSTEGRDQLVVCTLKDAVKLAPMWPASAPALWYVSQALRIESGGDQLEKVLSRFAPPAPAETADQKTSMASPNP